MASTAELNAAFDAMKADLHYLVSAMIPSFFQRQAIEHIDSAEGRTAILDGVKKVLAAAEKVREAESQKASKP